MKFLILGVIALIASSWAGPEPSGYVYESPSEKRFDLPSAEENAPPNAAGASEVKADLEQLKPNETPAATGFQGYKYDATEIRPRANAAVDADISVAHQMETLPSEVSAAAKDDTEVDAPPKEPAHEGYTYNAPKDVPELGGTVDVLAEASEVREVMAQANIETKVDVSGVQEQAKADIPAEVEEKAAEAKVENAAEMVNAKDNSVVPDIEVKAQAATQGQARPSPAAEGYKYDVPEVVPKIYPSEHQDKESAIRMKDQAAHARFQAKSQPKVEAAQPADVVTKSEVPDVKKDVPVPVEETKAEVPAEAKEESAESKADVPAEGKPEAPEVKETSPVPESETKVADGDATTDSPAKLTSFEEYKYDAPEVVPKIYSTEEGYKPEASEVREFVAVKEEAVATTPKPETETKVEVPALREDLTPPQGGAPAEGYKYNAPDVSPKIYPSEDAREETTATKIETKSGVDAEVEEPAKPVTEAPIEVAEVKENLPSPATETKADAAASVPTASDKPHAPQDDSTAPEGYNYNAPSDAAEALYHPMHVLSTGKTFENQQPNQAAAPYPKPNTIQSEDKAQPKKPFSGYHYERPAKAFVF